MGPLGFGSSTVRKAHVAPNVDRRKHSRVRVSLLGRFMLQDRREYPCQTVDMSPGGVALISPVKGVIGERVVAYLDQIGRVEGQIARHIDGGFAMTIAASPRKRDKLANQLTWLANRHVLNLPEDRRHDRFAPKTSITQIGLPDGRVYKCRIVDVSLSGAAVQCEVKPQIGTRILFGRMRATVVRHFEDGLALEFLTTQTEESLARGLDG